MAGLSFGSGKRFAGATEATHETAAESRAGRGFLSTVGFFGYAVPVFVLVVLPELLDDVAVFDSIAARAVVALAFPVLAAWRGFTVSAVVRPTEVHVRNRWRSVTLTHGEIEAVEVRPSAPYALIAFLWSIRDLATMSDADIDGGYGDLSLADTLMIRRRGHRRRLPMYATLGMSEDLDSMQPFLDALAAAGHPVDLDDLLIPPDDPPADD